MRATSTSTGEKSKELQLQIQPRAIPPIAKWDYSPKDGIIADKTLVRFINLSTGTFLISSWFFESYNGGTGTSTETNPSYIFNTEGDKLVRLYVKGSIGESPITSQSIKVHAMPPSCKNYNDGSTQSSSKITQLRSAGLKMGRIQFNNNYNNVTAKIELYHPDDWQAGRYTAYANSFWGPYNPSATSGYLGNGTTAYTISNDWGVKVIFSDNSESCIRSLNSVATYQNNIFLVKSSTIYE